MEFYPSLSTLCQTFGYGFNSQRDGILPTGKDKTPIYTKVSTPNGMEFYSIRKVIIANSVLFQLPTGWNSTVRAYQSFKFRSAFQLPTGWNSTNLHFLALALGYSFNSQRDGILRAASFCSIPCQFKFQLPTGWNSTCALPQIDALLKLFQLPTGWNSTLPP